MSSLAKVLFPISETDIKNVRNHFGKNEEEINKDLEVIKMWMEQQKHFPDDYDPVRIERIHLRNKFRVERTKEKLEKYYTSKGNYKDFFEKMDMKKEDMKKCLSTVVFVPMPKLLKETERIFVMRFYGNENDYNFEINFLLTNAMLELEYMHDYASGMRIIIDFKNLTMSHMKTININSIAKMFEIYQEVLSGRIMKMEYVNAPSFFGIMLDMLKIAIPEKLYRKISLHKNVDSLKASIPEEYLPSDYGGKLRSTEDIFVDVQKFLLENNDYLLSRVDKIADESKRIGPVQKNELFGLDGTFKKINLD